GHWFAIGTYRSAVRFFQSGNDVKKRRFAAAARADETDEFPLRNIQAYLVESEDRARCTAKALRDVLDRELAGSYYLQLFANRRDRSKTKVDGTRDKHLESSSCWMRKDQGSSTSFEVSVEPL